MRNTSLFGAVTALGILSFMGPRYRSAFGGNGPLFDPDPPTGGGGSGGPDPKEKKPDPKEPDPKEKLLPQSKVDEIVKDRIAERDRKHLEETQKLLGEKDLTERERKRLEEQAETLKSNLLTAKEKEAEERAKLVQGHTKKEKELADDRDGWRGRYQVTETKRQIREACSPANFDAKNVDQIMDMVEHKVKLVEEKDATTGEKTGEYLLVIDVEEMNAETKKKVKKSMLVSEYIQKMAESEKHGNLFHTQRISGSGARRSGDGKGSKGDAGGKSLMSAKDKIGAGLAQLGKRS